VIEAPCWRLRCIEVYRARVSRWVVDAGLCVDIHTTRYNTNPNARTTTSTMQTYTLTHSHTHTHARAHTQAHTHTGMLGSARFCSSTRTESAAPRSACLPSTFLPLYNDNNNNNNDKKTIIIIIIKIKIDSVRGSALVGWILSIWWHRCDVD
jgi:hypothetical protein